MFLRQAGLELLGSSHCTSSASQVAVIVGEGHHAWLFPLQFLNVEIELMWSQVRRENFLKILNS
jgi:hypothetical protein